ncbi:MAG TPA: hypothetical protein VIU12_32075 [Chryseolinea sp.]
MQEEDLLHQKKRILLANNTPTKSISKKALAKINSVHFQAHSPHDVKKI